LIAASHCRTRAIKTLCQSIKTLYICHQLWRATPKQREYAPHSY
jgi:hypothetical protein